MQMKAKACTFPKKTRADSIEPKALLLLSALNNLKVSFLNLHESLLQQALQQLLKIIILNWLLKILDRWKFSDILSSMLIIY